MQMETIVFIILQMFFATHAHGFENWGVLLGYFPVLVGNVQSVYMFRPIACEQKYLMDYNQFYTMA